MTEHRESATGPSAAGVAATTPRVTGGRQDGLDVAADEEFAADDAVVRQDADHSEELTNTRETNPVTDDVARHDPTICQTGRTGCWSYCTCGWRSPLMTSVTGAHVEFGRHLLAVRKV